MTPAITQAGTPVTPALPAQQLAPGPAVCYRLLVLFCRRHWHRRRDRAVTGMAAIMAEARMIFVPTAAGAAAATVSDRDRVTATFQAEFAACHDPSRSAGESARRADLVEPSQSVRS